MDAGGHRRKDLASSRGGRARGIRATFRLGLAVATALAVVAPGAFASAPFGVTCSVAISSTHNGPLEVTTSVCIVGGGEVTGAITVSGGGSLDIEHGTVDGSITANGGSGAIRICGSQVGGAVDIKNQTGLVTVGSATDASCAPNGIGGAQALANDNMRPPVVGAGTPPPFSGFRPAGAFGGVAGAIALAIGGLPPGTPGTNVFPSGAAGLLGTSAAGCGTEHLGPAGLLSALPVISVVVRGGPASCATAWSVIGRFIARVVKHAKVLGYSCTRLTVRGLARCVKGAITITGERMHP